MAESTPFAPIIEELGRSIDVVDGRPLLPKDQLPTWIARLRAVPESAQKETATQLVGLAIKVRKLAGAQADSLMLQLAELVAAVLRSAEASVAAFDKAGVNLKKSAASIGIDTATRLADKSDKPAGASSVFDFLLNKNKT